MKDLNTWKTLADREKAALSKLSERKKSLSIEKERLEKRINDIDRYILEYTSGMKQETGVEHSVQKINSKMNMVTQLASGRKELEKIHRECQLALEVVTKGMIKHQEELLKFNKVSENQRKLIIKKEKYIENKEIDSLALHNFVSEMR
tara:strand:+ start:654 stop:1097 length:444 start_codon:yes stop_codon:yes gene_type:complete